MKVGPGNGRQVAAACGLTVLALFLLGHWIFGRESSASASTGRGASSIRSSKPTLGKTMANEFDPLDPTLHFSRLALTEREVYQGRGRNIFGSYDEDQRGKTAPRPQPPAPPAIQPVQPPTIGLKFFGIARISGWPRRACLSQEGDIFIAGAGDIVDRRYKLLRIGDFAVDVQDLLGNDTYTLTLQR
jgi:hypothetical protein